MAFSTTVVSIQVWLGTLELDHDMVTRFKILPVVSAAMYTSAYKLSNGHVVKTHQVLAAYCVVALALFELLLSANCYSKMIIFSLLTHILVFLLKFSGTNKHAKVLMTVLTVAYYSVRLFLHTDSIFGETVRLKDLLPFIGMATVQSFSFDLDEEINRLLNTRFHKTQRKWFQCLESMPVAVMLYNTKR